MNSFCRQFVKLHSFCGCQGGHGCADGLMFPQTEVGGLDFFGTHKRGKHSIAVQ